jgi:hypothetical protein
MYTTNALYTKVNVASYVFASVLITNEGGDFYKMLNLMQGGLIVSACAVS